MTASPTVSPGNALPDIARTAWHSLSTGDVLAQLRTDDRAGLTAIEAEARLAQFGENALSEAPRPTFLQRLLAQFNDFVIYLLIFAAIVSFLLGDTIEAVVIAAIVILNAIVGVVQEGRAEQALAALKKLAAPNARVRRDGRTESRPASQLVPGDVVFIEAGDSIPADVRLIETANLKVEEASLTGESVPVDKNSAHLAAADAALGDRHNMLYMSTVANYGRGRGVVVGTGMRTEMGKIAGLLQETAEEQTPLQRRLNELGRTLSIAALVICGVVFAIGALQSISGGADVLDSLRESFIIAISLAVAAVPEGLPAIVTINLAIGMREMIRRNALVRRLPAVETLGSATAICSDKTGTLTQNQMTVVRLYVDGEQYSLSGEGYDTTGDFTDASNRVVKIAEHGDLLRLLQGGLLASDAYLEPLEANRPVSGRWRVVGDPTEGALVVAAGKANLWRDGLEKQYPRVAEVPFDSNRKRMSTLHTLPDGTTGVLAFVKGAPDVILDLCSTMLHDGETVPLTDERRAEVLAANSAFASKALRVLAVAQRHFPAQPTEVNAESVEAELTFVGLIAMIDPARPEVKPAIAVARQAGIRTVMVTGDYPDTARAIGQEIGLLRPNGLVLPGTEIERMDDAQLDSLIDRVDVFARVSPNHKVRIVEAFQRREHIAAMTGDGVNDAPALKRADIGVAMGITGTDVSKEASDMILMDDNYATIVRAVEQGRIIYSNIRKFVSYLLTCNLAEISVILVATLLGWGSPLTAIQLLWLNLITDGAPALALGVEKGDPDTMRRLPRPVDEPIINYDMRIGMITQTIAKTVVTLLAFAIGRGDIAIEGIAPSAELATTMAFVTLAASELARAYTSRSELQSVFRIGVFSNPFMQLAVATSLIGLLLVIYVPFLQGAFDTSPLNLTEWLVMLPLIFIPAVVSELTKLYLRRLYTAQEKLIAQNFG